MIRRIDGYLRFNFSNIVSLPLLAVKVFLRGAVIDVTLSIPCAVII